MTDHGPLQAQLPPKKHSQTGYDTLISAQKRCAPYCAPKQGKLPRTNVPPWRSVYTESPEHGKADDALSVPDCHDLHLKHTPEKLVKASGKHFLYLPVELRLKIYAFVFTSMCIYPINLQASRPRHPKKSPTLQIFPIASLLVTNKQIHSEAWQLFWQIVTLDVEQFAGARWAFQTTMPCCLLRPSESWRSHTAISHLRIAWERLVFGFDFYGGGRWHHIAGLFAEILQHELRSVRVVLRGCSLRNYALRWADLVRMRDTWFSKVKLVEYEVDIGSGISKPSAEELEEVNKAMLYAFRNDENARRLKERFVWVGVRPVQTVWEDDQPVVVLRIERNTVSSGPSAWTLRT